MGTFFSRFREGTYYANFEKSLERINNTKERIQQRKTRRGEAKKALSRRVVSLGLILSLLASVYVAWVYKQPIERFSHNGRVLRTSLIVDVPLLMILIHQFVLWCFGFLLKWDDRLLSRLEKTFNEMLADLKDQNHYDRIVELLQKYDPEEQEKQKLLESAKNPAPLVSQPDSDQPAFAKSSSFGGSLISGAGKVVDKVANRIIGDQPELIDEIEELKNKVQVLEERNRELEEENKSLKEQLEIKSIPEQESES